MLSLQHPDGVTSVDLSDDGLKATTWSEDKRVRVWDLSTGTIRSELGCDFGDGWAACLSHEHGLLATISMDNVARVWNSVTGAPVSELRGHKRVVWCVEMSKDGRLLATASNDKTARVWNSLTGECLHVLEGHPEGVQRVCFSSDCRFLATACYGAMVKVWDVQTWACLSTKQMGSQPIWCLALSSNCRYLFYSNSYGIGRVCDLKTGATIYEINVYWTFSRVAFTPDGRSIVVAGQYGNVHVRDVRTRETLKVLHRHSDWIYSLSVSSDGNLALTGSKDNTACVWDTTHDWKKVVWAVLSTKRWDGEMARELVEWF